MMQLSSCVFIYVQIAILLGYLISWNYLLDSLLFQTLNILKRTVHNLFITLLMNVNKHEKKIKSLASGDKSQQKSRQIWSIETLFSMNIFYYKLSFILLIEFYP